MLGVAVTADDPRGEGRGPEPVAGSGEAHADLGRVGRRVQSDAQQRHPRPDRVGQRRRPGRADAERGPARAGPLDRHVDQAGALEHRVQQLVGPQRERPPREVVVLDGSELLVTTEQTEVHRRPRPQHPVEVPQGHGHVGPGQVHERLVGPDRAHRAPTEGESGQVGLQRSGPGVEVAHPSDEGEGGVEPDPGRGERPQVAAGAAPEVEDRRVASGQAGRESCRVGRGRGPRRLPFPGPRLVDVDGLAVHGRPQRPGSIAWSLRIPPSHRPWSVALLRT